jgi:hypothetical protein
MFSTRHIQKTYVASNDATNPHPSKSIEGSQEFAIRSASFFHAKSHLFHAAPHARRLFSVEQKTPQKTTKPFLTFDSIATFLAFGQAPPKHEH